jgi:hypothetical protein
MIINAGKEASAGARSWKIRLRLPSDSAAAPPQVVRPASTCNTCNTCSKMQGAGVGAGKASQQVID